MFLPPFLLERYLGEYEFSAPHLLCTSDCETISVSDLLSLEEGGAEKFAALRLGYTEASGGKELRKEIAEMYGSLSPDDILVFAGAEEGIFAFMNTALTPGDSVIVQWPAYQSLHEVARAAGCRVDLWEMREEDGWRPDPETLCGMITPKTKALILNSPHNPTGYNFNPEEFERIFEIARESGIRVFSDEVYRFSEYDPSGLLPPAADLCEDAVSLGVMSKSFGLAGLRIGWIATQDKDLLNRLSGFKDYTSICCSAPSEALATLAIRHKKEICGRNLPLILHNLSLLDGFFSRQSDLFRWIRPSAGPVGFVHLLSGSASAFCREAVEEAGVLLLPSETYGMPDSHFRIGFGRADMEESLRVFEEWVDKRKEKEAGGHRG